MAGFEWSQFDNQEGYGDGNGGDSQGIYLTKSCQSLELLILFQVGENWEKVKRCQSGLVKNLTMFDTNTWKQIVIV